MSKASLFNLLSRGGSDSLSPLTYRMQRASTATLVVCAALLAAFLVLLLFVFVRRAPAARTPAATGDRSLHAIVFVWGATVASIAGLVFWLGYGPFMDAAVPPGNAYEISATSIEGRWQFEYPNGTTSLNQLAVPRGQPVRVVLSSADRLHEFYLPRFKIRQTAIPGRYSSAWFLSNRLLSAPIECETYCPRQEGAAPASLRVLDAAPFEEWLSATRKTKIPAAPAKVGGTQ